ncbi:uncharacterized protein LOC129737816 [Uranotaenia lowii]|uniref:uncharacterized protein LOC129737816 n=1 Tax=Uranotaenia lowii TaxID=190385 RepID=UPI00247A5CFB|nr:uncharacterized protein LOC129737816 [Uranotaenia lowii]
MLLIVHLVHVFFLQTHEKFSLLLAWPLSYSSLGFLKNQDSVKSPQHSIEIVTSEDRMCSSQCSGLNIRRLSKMLGMPSDIGPTGEVYGAPHPVVGKIEIEAVQAANFIGIFGATCAAVGGTTLAECYIHY